MYREERGAFFSHSVHRGWMPFHWDPITSNIALSWTPKAGSHSQLFLLVASHPMDVPGCGAGVTRGVPHAPGLWFLWEYSGASWQLSAQVSFPKPKPKPKQTPQNQNQTKTKNTRKNPSAQSVRILRTDTYTHRQSSLPICGANSHPEHAYYPVNKTQPELGEV